MDLWSAGCIFAEMGCGNPLFAGDSEIDTVFKIFQKLGTPKEEKGPSGEQDESDGMSIPNLYLSLPDMKSSFPRWRKKAWRDIRGLGEEEKIGSVGCELLERLMRYDPNRRLGAKEALKHSFFDEKD